MWQLYKNGAILYKQYSTRVICIIYCDILYYLQIINNIIHNILYKLCNICINSADIYTKFIYNYTIYKNIELFWREHCII